MRRGPRIDAVTWLPSSTPKLSAVIDTSSAALRGTVLGLLEQAARGDDGSVPPIVQLGHPALRAPAAPFDGQLSALELELLIGIMRRVMHAAPGVGLAAPQLGIPLQLAVIEDRFSSDPAIAEARSRTELPFFAILNPSYSPVGDRTASFFEGCLSFDGYQAVVQRPYAVSLEYSRPDGSSARQEFKGWPARIVQHETDHLNGTIYVDLAPTRSLVSNGEYNRRWTQPTVDAAARELGF